MSARGFLTHLLFPPTCRGCGERFDIFMDAEPMPLCPSCLEAWQTAKLHRCAVCGGAVSTCDCMPALLKQAGVTKGEFTIAVRNNAVDVAIANYAKDVWKGLGFTVNVKKYGGKKMTTANEYEVYVDEFEQAFKKGEFDVAAIDLQMFSTDAFATLAGFALGYSGTALDLAHPEEGGWDLKPGVTGYNSKAYNEKIDAAFNEKLDRATKTKYLHEAEQILLEDMPVTPLVTLQNAYVSSKKFSGFSFDYYGCPVMTKAKLSKYELYTNVEEEEKNS